jgi:hypothetical protein
MKRTYSAFLAAFFAILLVASLGGLYYAYQTPTEVKLASASYEYQNQGIFDYTAILVPNLIYNRTTLGKGEGTLFRRITDSIVLNFTYTFNSSKPSNITVSYKTYECVTTPLWTKMISETPEETLNTTGIEAHVSMNDAPFLNVSSVEYLVTRINQETGIGITQFTVNVTVQIRVDADYGEGSISDLFTPQLTAGFSSTATGGDIISIGGLEDSKTGRVMSTETVQQPWVVTERYFLSGFFFASVLGFAIAGWLYLKRGPPPREVTRDEVVEEIIAPYEEIIFETAGEPKKEEATTIVTVKTLENLIGIADILSKPVLQTQKPEGKIEFQVVDGNTRYKYEATVSESSKETAGEVSKDTAGEED